MADLSQYSDEQLQAAMSNPNAGSRLKRDIQTELNKRQPQAALDPMTGAPTGGAPQFMANMAPSMMNLGQDMAQGIGQAVMHPMDTLQNFIPGIAQHYSSRYGSPQQAMNTFNTDPAGAMFDVAPIGTVLRGVGAAGNMGRVAATGRAMERMDPMGLVAGGMQGLVAGAQNAIPFVRSAEETMAGTYGQPRGRQRENLPGYLDTVGQAMDQGFEPNVQGATQAKAASSAAGAKVGSIIADLEASGRTGSRSDLVRKLLDLQKSADSGVQGPYRNAIDNLINDLMKGTDNTISLSEMQKLKETYAGLVNYDSATPPVDRLTQQGYSDASKVLREDLRNMPGLANAYDAYGNAMGVQDVVQRGAAADVAASGRGLAGDFVAQMLNATAPILTGQTKMQRNAIRRNLANGNYLDAAAGLTERTLYGPLREGAYLAEQTRVLEDDQKWDVGVLFRQRGQ